VASDVIKASMEFVMRPWVASCDETRERLSAHLEGELTGREQKRVLRHLVRCKHCRAVLESLAHTLDHLRSLARVETPAPTPATTASAVIERIRREPR
jgi:predicted anti-sigma-YlaC factor YlaD